jgi:hypothetical protein
MHHTLERMIKLNDKVFTIITSIPGRFMEASAPDGTPCHIDPQQQFVMHRDVTGRLQSERVTR